MEALTLSVDTLPMQIRKKFRTPRVTVQERDGGVILLPIPVNEGSGLLGLAENDNLTLKEFFTYKNEDRESER